MAIPTVTPVLTVAASYATGDYVGTSGVAMVFANSASPFMGNAGAVIGAELIDAASQNIQTELWLFDTAVTPPADSAAWTITDADAKSCLGVIIFNSGDYLANAQNSVCQGLPQNGPFRFEGATIYGCLVTRGSPSYASLDLTVRLSTIAAQ